MKKIALVIFIGMLLLLSACSSEPKYTSVYEAINSIEKDITPIDPSAELKLEGVTPVSYKMHNDEVIRVYEFESADKREDANKQFDDNNQMISTHAPIIYHSGKILVLYYSHVDSKTRTPKKDETQYGEKIAQALKDL